MKTISIASDHAGFALKERAKQRLEEQGYEVKDYGCHSADSMDYPDVVHPLALNLLADGRGVLICGSGNGVCITANKYAHIRAALCWDAELAKLARQHNNANVLCLPARFVPEETALACIDAFLNTEFEGGRHQKRVEKIAPLS